MKNKWVIMICALGMALAMSGCASTEKNNETGDSLVNKLSYHMIDDKYRTFYEIFPYSFYF